MRPCPYDVATRWWMAFAIVVAASVRARAQQPAATPVPAYRFRLMGVYDANSGDPIENAEVTDLKSGTSALTTKTGTVSLVFLPDGGSLVRVRKVGYAPITQLALISPDDTVPITLLLLPSATLLPTVVTRDSAPQHLPAGIRGFEERRKAGMGHFIAEAELRKSDNRRLQDVLRSVPGVNILCSRRGITTCIASSMRSGCRGGYLVFLDGMRSGDTNLDQMQVSDYAGIEVYNGPATIPAEYNATGSACGALLLWSRFR